MPALEENDTKVLDLNKTLLQFGKFGTFQWKNCTILSLTAIFSVWHVISLTFIAAIPDHHCNLPDGSVNIPQTGEIEFNSCNMYINATLSNSTQPCPDGWKYGKEFGVTIATDWDLVCENMALIDLSGSIFMIGSMIGGLIFLALSDKYGRKPCLLVCHVLFLIFGLSVAFSNSYTTFTILRFFHGVCQQGLFLLGVIMCTELFPSEYRYLSVILSNLFWAVGVMTLTLLAYLIKNWRILQICLSAILIFYLILMKYVPESLPWLLANNQQKLAKDILLKAAKVGQVRDFILYSKPVTTTTKIPDNLKSNKEGTGKKKSNTISADSNYLESTKEAPEKRPKAISMTSDKLDPTNFKSKTSSVVSENIEPIKEGKVRKKSKTSEISDNLEETEKKSTSFAADVNIQLPNFLTDTKTYNFLDIFTTPYLQLYAVIMFYLWFMSALSYFGLIMSAGALAGDLYLNTLLGGLVEVPACAVPVFTHNRFGRRVTSIIIFFVAGIPLITFIVLPDIPWMAFILTLISRFGAVASFQIIIVYSVEIFPTVVRGFGIGISNLCAGMGMVISPFMLEFGRNNLKVTYSILGVLLMIAVGLSFLLPETNFLPLVENIEDYDKQLPSISWLREKKSKDTKKSVQFQNYENCFS